MKLPLRPCTASCLWFFSQRPSSAPSNQCPRGRSPRPSAAQKIFIANAGMDAFSLQAFRGARPQRRQRLRFPLRRRQKLAQYQLVSSPADADLVLEIRVTAPLTNVGDHATWDFQHILANTTWQFQTDLVIRDAKSHFLLWTVTEPVRPANLAGTWRKNIATANAAVAGDLKSLLTPSAPPTP